MTMALGTQPHSQTCQREKEKMGVEDEGEVWSRRLFMSDLPDAVSVEMLQEAADKDGDYAKLRTAVMEGHKPKDGDLTQTLTIFIAICCWPTISTF